MGGYGGLIVIKNGSLKKYLNDSNFLKLPAILNGAAGLKLELNKNVQPAVICCPGTLTTVFWAI